MTKEQQKALETANRRKFVNNIAIVAMTDILDQAENIRKTLDVKMRYQNYNRYIHLHKYCLKSQTIATMSSRLPMVQRCFARCRVLPTP